MRLTRDDAHDAAAAVIMLFFLQNHPLNQQLVRTRVFLLRGTRLALALDVLANR